MLTIGLFGPADDQEVRALASRLEGRGVEPWIVDLAGFPRTCRMSAREGFEVDGRSLLDMDAAYLRRAGYGLRPELRYGEKAGPLSRDDWARLHPEIFRELRIERASHAFRTAALRRLASRRPVINPPDLQNLHRTKTFELEKLRAAGLPVPPFAAGTDRGALSGFCHRAKQEGWAGVVTKPPAGIYKTRLVEDPSLADHPFERRPALLQRYIPGDTVRCYAVGGRFLSAARIVHGGTVDSSVSQTGIEVIELSRSGRDLVEATARVLDLEFCGMDLMIEKKSQAEYVIDCNISPMFVNYGYLSGCDVAGHLADHLIARASAGQRGYTRPAVADRVETAKDAITRDPELAALLRRAIKPRKG